jgi:hypothetical protein
MDIKPEPRMAGSGSNGRITPTTSAAAVAAAAQAENDVQLHSKIPKILPHERVFPIQIGSELFKLSGASLSSDGE